MFNLVQFFLGQFKLLNPPPPPTTKKKKKMKGSMLKATIKEKEKKLDETVLLEINMHAYN